jgi:hypothetical protein
MAGFHQDYSGHAEKENRLSGNMQRIVCKATELI